MRWRNAGVAGAVAARQTASLGRDVCIDGSAPLELATAVVRATTVGTLTVVGDDDECIGHLRCMDDERGGRVPQGPPWVGASAGVGLATSLARDAAIADALRSLRSEGRTRAVVIDGSGRRLAVLSTAPIGPPTDVACHEDFATEWDARLG